MRTAGWLTSDHQLAPGAEIFRAERCFQFWSHTASHSQTLLRSPAETDRLGRAQRTRVDVLFKPVTVMKICQNYDDLVVRVATDAEAATVRAESPNAGWPRDVRVFVLESRGQSDYVVAQAVGWHEDTLEACEPSAFAGHDADTPAWGRTPLFGVDGGLDGNVATARQLLDALVTEPPVPLERDRYRYVYAVQTRFRTGIGDPFVGCAGVFLTKEEAEAARVRLAARADGCWIDAVPIGI